MEVVVHGSSWEVVVHVATVVEVVVLTTVVEVVVHGDGSCTRYIDVQVVGRGTW